MFFYNYVRQAPLSQPASSASLHNKFALQTLDDSSPRREPLNKTVYFAVAVMSPQVFVLGSSMGPTPTGIKDGSVRPL